MQIMAAKRALKIINTLAPGDFRARHASRVFSNLNRLRSKYVRAKKDAARVAGIIK